MEKNFVVKFSNTVVNRFVADSQFVKQFWNFVKEGQYEQAEAEGDGRIPQLYDLQFERRVQREEKRASQGQQAG